ncbi:FtsX-like permease family protein [Saccharothrix isguenensis]
MKRWFSDLALGVRLAVGGGRTSWVRLALTGAGIGIGVAVLLAAASVTTVLSERAERQADREPVTASSTGAEEASGDVLYSTLWHTAYRGEPISGHFVKGSGPDAPVPPGMSRVPGDGELFVSPALRELLESPEGQLLRERFPQRIVGTIDQSGLNAPHDLLFYAGDATVEEDGPNATMRFGGTVHERTLDPLLTLLIMVGVVALLFPVLVFVGISTRLAGAERDRRLAALRLVGAGGFRVRRIAAGESLLGAFVGLAVGTALFFGARQFVESVRLLGISVFVSDLTPSLPLAVLIAVLVPVMAVVTSVLAMRHTVIEPLGVVRRAKPVRRALWWRVVPLVVGGAALTSQSGTLGGEENQASEPVVVGGILMLLLSIPVLLPWVVERAVGRMRGGAPSWQLAIRRLQLESGTAARVVGGVAVVLAGGIALQSIMASAESEILDDPLPQADHSRMVISMRDATPEVTGQTVGLLERSTGVERVHTTYDLLFAGASDLIESAVVGTCEALEVQADLPSCQDGDAFYVRRDVSYDSGSGRVEAGQEVTVYAGTDADGQLRRGPRWTVPEYTVIDEPGASIGFRQGLFLTPSAVRDLPVLPGSATLHVMVDRGVPDVAEHVRNAVAPMAWRSYTSYFGEAELAQRVEEFQSIRRGLLAGSLITLLFASASLLVLALEQVRERRRPLAVLAASGVPRGALSRSLLWQNAVPLLLAVVVAVVVGGSLAALLLKVISQPVVLDWPGIALLSGAAALMVVVVTILSLPSLRRATGALGLRSE